MSEFRFKSVLKDPEESLQPELRLYSFCARFWKRNELYTLGEFIRPLVANGFSYECTVGGTTSAAEPQWKEVIGDTLIDGSVTWTCRAAGSNGINPLTSPSAAPMTGFTISNVTASEDFKILATYAGGTVGKDYDVKFTFTLNGVTRIARQRVQVRER